MESEAVVPSNVWISSPEYAGWLLKRGQWLQYWNKRWVALHGAEIVYMYDEPTKNNDAYKKLTKLELTIKTVIDKLPEDKAFGFTIHFNDSAHSPAWHLRGSSEENKQNWLVRLGYVLKIIRWLDEYEKVRVLGTGGFGIVYELVHKKDGRRFAMKAMEIKSHHRLKDVLAEIEMLKAIMERVSHPNILHIEQIYQVGSKFYLLFPICTGGELYEHISKRHHYCEQDAADIFRDIISGLHALHEHDILHLDIKPENILFDHPGPNAVVKITDFGLSKVLSDLKPNQARLPSVKELESKLDSFLNLGQLKPRSGTVGYMSPELILTDCKSKASDVFAAGVVLYVMLCGQLPFRSQSNRRVLELSAQCQYEMDQHEWESISDDAKDLVKNILVFDPHNRLTTAQILQHPWLCKSRASTAKPSVEDPSISSELSTSVTQSIQLMNIDAAGNLHEPRDRKRHLTGTMKKLSTQVNFQRTQKFAKGFTNLISTLAGGGSNVHGSVLSGLVVSKAKRSSRLSSTSIPMNGGNGDNEAAMASAVINSDGTLLQNQDAKSALATLLASLGDEQGRITLQQFLFILKGFVFGAVPAATPVADSADNDGETISLTANPAADVPEIASSAMPSMPPAAGAGDHEGASAADTPASHNEKRVGTGLALMLLCRFVDQDGDGMISAEDVFSTQALVMQRSEAFLKVVFRIYSESLWYYGRFRNFLRMQSLFNAQPAAVGPGGTSILGSELKSADVFEPPQFITAAHVSAVFERLGFEGSGGVRIFTALYRALARRRALGTPQESTRSSSVQSVTESFSDAATESMEAASVAVDVGSSAAPINRTMSTRVDIEIGPDTDAGLNEDGTHMKMDVNDFVKACEIDDVLLQVLVNNVRGGIVLLLQDPASHGPDDATPDATTLLSEAKEVGRQQAARDKKPFFPVVHSVVSKAKDLVGQISASAVSHHAPDTDNSA